MCRPFCNLLFSIAAIVTFAGCDTGTTSTPQPPASSKIKILVSPYPLADMVRQVGGDRVEVQWLFEAGQRPEEVEVTPDLRQRANRSALFFTSGPSDSWASQELNNDARANRLIEPGRTPAGRQADTNAYLWLDPQVMRELTDTAKNHLTAIDPAHNADYASAAAAYRESIDKIDQQYRHTLAPFKSRRLLAISPCWAALCKRFNLTLLTPVTATEEKLTPADFRELARTAKENNLKTILIDAATSVAVRQQIEEKTTLTAIPLDPLGTSAPDARNTWERIMQYNLEQLQKALQ